MQFAKDYREILSGQRVGLWPSLLRGALSVASFPYGCGVRWRNARYDRGQAEIVRVSVPVISVGNLTAGGTGKSPFIAWLATWCRQQGKRPAIISRGYGARAGAANDEALELAQNLPDVPHRQNRDRVAAAEQAIRETGCNVLLLDDAFQHRRIHRDLDIVLIDALEPFGFDHLLPRGLLREPPENLRRADVLVLSRADAVSAARRIEIRDAVRRFAPQAVWVEAAHQPSGLRNVAHQNANIATLAGQPVFAFCGIGNPAGFRHTLAVTGINVVGFLPFPDHHSFTLNDFAAITTAARDCRATAIVCTHKDLVKCDIQTTTDDIPLWALTVKLAVSEGLEALQQRLRQAVTSDVS